MGTLQDMPDLALAWRVLVMALMTIDRQKQGKPPEPWLETEWPDTVSEVNRRWARDHGPDA